MERRTKYTTKTRTLADGTVKRYRSVYHYNVKNGVNDRRHEGNSGAKEKLSQAQRDEIWEKYRAGIKIKRICADIGVSYAPVKKCIDKKKAELIPQLPAEVPNVPAEVPIVPAEVPTVPVQPEEVPTVPVQPEEVQPVITPVTPPVK